MKTIKISLEELEQEHIEQSEQDENKQSTELRPRKSSIYYITTTEIDYMVGGTYSIMDITIPVGKEINGVGRLRVVFDTGSGLADMDSIDVNLEDSTDWKIQEDDWDSLPSIQDVDTTCEDELEDVQVTDEFPSRSKTSGEELIESLIKSDFIDLEEYSSRILEIIKYYRVNTYVTENIYREIEMDKVPKQEELLWRHGDVNSSELN